MSDVFPPSESFSQKAHFKSLEEYQTEYDRSVANPEAFWADKASEFHWFRKWETVCAYNYDMDKAPIKIKWFTGGKTNITYNCLDRHLADRGDQVAIIWEGNEPGEDEEGVRKEGVFVCARKRGRGLQPEVQSLRQTEGFRHDLMGKVMDRDHARYGQETGKHALGPVVKVEVPSGQDPCHTHLVPQGLPPGTAQRNFHGPAIAVEEVGPVGDDGQFVGRKAAPQRPRQVYGVGGRTTQRPGHSSQRNLHGLKRPGSMPAAGHRRP